MNQKASKKSDSVVRILVLPCVFVLFQTIGYTQEIKPVVNISSAKVVDANQIKRDENLDEIIRVDTDLVTVPAAVFDRAGRYVVNLKKEDFQLFEDGVEQEIAFFETTEQPFTILFLIDVSGSMQPYKEKLAIAINALGSRLRPNDTIMTNTFFLSVNELVKSSKISELTKGVKISVREDDDCPATYLYNAVDDAFKRMKKIRGRKAIVLFSDGVGDGYGVSAKDNLHMAEELDAMVFTFKFGTYSSNPPDYVNKKEYFKRIGEIDAYMRDLALKTGGRAFQVEELTDIVETCRTVTDELGKQYSLGYYPKQMESGKKRSRKIKVKTRQPNLAVRARETYGAEVSKK